MTNKSRAPRIHFNAPAVLSFVLICFAAQLLNQFTQGASNRALFSVYRSSLANPLTYVRCLTHVFGHGDWNHLLSNMMLLLILGPMLEEKYGTSNLLCVMAVTAVVTGIVNMVFFPHVALLGASGVVFAMILLSSITSTREGTIPLTFLLVAVLYIGQQVYQMLSADNISQMAHIVGAAVGSALGFVMERHHMSRYQESRHV